MIKKKEDIEIGKRIKDIRAGLKMDQKTFSGKLGCTVSALSNWENGRNKPNDIMIKEISRLGGVSVDYLLNGYKDLLGNEMPTGEFAFFTPTLLRQSILSRKKETNTVFAYIIVKLSKDNETKYSVLRCTCRLDSDFLTEIYVENCPNKYDIYRFVEVNENFIKQLPFKDGNWFSNQINFNFYIFDRKPISKSSLNSLFKEIEEYIKDMGLWKIENEPKFFYLTDNNKIKSFNSLFI